MSVVIGTSGGPRFDRESPEGAGPAVTSPTRWDAKDLGTIDTADEVELATRRSDGTLRSTRIVWIVRHDHAVYVRSVNGGTAAWYRGVQTRHEGELTAGGLQRRVVLVEAGEHAGDGGGLDDGLDAAYRDKYGRASSAVARITADIARATTLRVDPV